MSYMTDKNLRAGYDNLCSIRIHMDSLWINIDFIKREQYGRASIAHLRAGFLDVRIIIEEMMLLSVSAHRSAGSTITAALQSSYSASKKMGILRKLNKKFFPDAIDAIESEDESVAGAFISVKENYLTEQEAKKYYHLCDNYLHASHQPITEQKLKIALTKLSDFLTLTERLLRTFELDISGSGLLVVGHLNFAAREGPALFHAPMTETNTDTVS